MADFEQIIDFILFRSGQMGKLQERNFFFLDEGKIKVVEMANVIWS